MTEKDIAGKDLNPFPTAKGEEDFEEGMARMLMSHPQRDLAIFLWCGFLKSSEDPQSAIRDEKIPLLFFYLKHFLDGLNHAPRTYN